jgi:lipoprotein NlpI
MLGKFLIHFVLAATMLAGTAAADDESDCFSSESPTRIDACTRLISMPGQQKEALASAHHQRGLAYLAAGQDARSKLDFDRALVLAPDNPSVLTMASLGAGLGTTNKQRRFASAIKAAPPSRPLTSTAPSATARINNAIKDFQKVTEFSRQDADAYYGQFLHTPRKDTKQAINSRYQQCTSSRSRKQDD